MSRQVRYSWQTAQPASKTLPLCFLPIFPSLMWNFNSNQAHLLTWSPPTSSLPLINAARTTPISNPASNSRMKPPFLHSHSLADMVFYSKCFSCFISMGVLVFSFLLVKHNMLYYRTKDTSTFLSINAIIDCLSHSSSLL